jgi:hypothetical protein
MQVVYIVAFYVMVEKEAKKEMEKDEVKEEI